ncbi:hypothetical protein EXS71_03305 [Candidatus Uhrbacteria bacterium]|nr:hypothetical protein [Candidatus Uhrbacteria bacterium]
MEKISKGEITKIILMTVGATGVLAVGLVCPNLLQLIPVLRRERYSYKSIWQAVYRLDKQGWIVARQGAVGWKITLTKKGKTQLLAYEIGQKKIKKPRRWDQKWRVLIFDIPEKRKMIRHKVRAVLLSLEFYRLQDSVWVYPYECQEVLDLLRTQYQVRSEALYMRVEFLQQDKWLRKHFQLPMYKNETKRSILNKIL